MVFVEWESCDHVFQYSSAGGVKPAQVAAARPVGWWHRQTVRHWSCHFPCGLLGGEFAPRKQRERERAAILKVTPHSVSDSAAVRNHDWRWRILLSWRDMPDSEMGKRCVAWLKICWRIWQTHFHLCFKKKFVSTFLPQWKTRWLVLRKPSPVAGKKNH